MHTVKSIAFRVMAVGLILTTSLLIIALGVVTSIMFVTAWQMNGANSILELILYVTGGFGAKYTMDHAKFLHLMIQAFGRGSLA